MDKRRVTVSVGGQRCSIYTDDPDEYVSALARRANDAIGQFSGMNAPAKAVLFLTDLLMRTEKKTESGEITEDGTAEAKTETGPAVKQGRKKAVKEAVNHNQVSVWDLLQKS